MEWSIKNNRISFKNGVPSGLPAILKLIFFYCKIMDFYCTKKELRELLDGVSKIGYIKGLEDARKIPKYLSQNEAGILFNKTRVRGWVEDGLIAPKPLGNGKTSTKLYEYSRLIELESAHQKKICIITKINILLHREKRPRSLVNRTTDSGSVGHRFESCRGHVWHTSQPK